jgi:hypothetical protein
MTVTEVIVVVGGDVVGSTGVVADIEGKVVQDIGVEKLKMASWERTFDNEQLVTHECVNSALRLVVWATFSDMAVRVQHCSACYPSHPLFSIR